MADIKLSLVNQALTAAGEDPVSELTGANALTRAAIENYDAIVNEELEKNAPRFAQRTAAANIQTATSDEPLKYRWTPPAEALSILAVLYNGVVLDAELYDIEADYVRTTYQSAISIKYVRRINEAFWSAQFCRIIVMRLEALFLRVTERHNEADGRDVSTERASIVARHRDATQRTGRPLNPGTIIEARFGLRHRR